MRVVIVGAGKVGYYIAERLAAEDHDVALIEQDDSVRETVQENLDILTLKGNGASPHALEEAGGKQADIILAVTDQDEVNMVVCQTAHILYPDAMKVARISNLEYFTEKSPLQPESLGIDTVINPERECSEQIVSLLKTPRASETADFAGGRVQMIAFRVAGDSPLEDMRLIDLKGGTIDLLRILALERDGTILIPRGGDVVREGDQAYIVGETSNMPTIFSFLNLESPKPEKVVIYGGKRIGRTLALMLETEDISVRVIDPSEEICSDLAETLKKAIVVQGDATSVEALRDAGVQDADAFVAVGESDEKNILSSILSKQLGARKAIASIEKAELVRVAEDLAHIDAVVSPRLSAVNSILRFVRRGRIISAIALHDLDAESMEIEVAAESRLVGRPLAETSPKYLKNAIVGAVVRQDEVIIPTGNTVIETGDKVILVALPSAIKSIEKAFAKSIISLVP